MNRTMAVILLVALTGASPLYAASEELTQTSPPEHGLTPVDWVIIFAYAAGTLLLGWHFGRKQKSTKEYFVGSGNMNPILIGVSLFATLLSTISYLSMPGEALGKGPVDMCRLFGLPIIYFFVGFVLLPVYMRQKVTSAYELLEAKLGLSIRLLGATLFIILRLVWMSLLLFLTAKAISVMIDVDKSWIPVIALIAGFVAVIYTSLGGLRAVVITDALQTVLLFGGALLVIAVVTIELKGFSWVPTEWNANWDLQPIFSLDPATRLTMVGALASQTVWYICTLGGDQTSVQRFMSTRDAKAARRALLTQLAVAVIVTLTLGFVGFALLGYFTAFPEFIPSGLDLKNDADDILPRFISFHLPPGISGLVVAAMFAAAMSSIDSGVNSITAVVMTDGLDRFNRTPKDDTAHVRFAMVLAFLIGTIVVVLSSVMGTIPGNITAVTNKSANLLAAPIFGLFFFALFVPFASSKGVWIATVVSTITAALIAFSGPIFGMVPLPGSTNGELTDPISFQWIAPITITVNILTGLIASHFLPDPPQSSSDS